MFFIGNGKKFKYFFKYNYKGLSLPVITLNTLFFVIIGILAFTFASFPSIAMETQKFAVYYFYNHTGDDNWNWLEKGLPDLLSQTFSQSEKIKYIPIEDIEKMFDFDSRQSFAKIIDIDLFHSLNNYLKADLIFSGHFSYEDGDKSLLKFNLIMYQASIDQFFEFREMIILPEDLLYLKENVARIILEEAGADIDNETENNLRKSLSTSLAALKDYYQAKELKNQAQSEYQGIDFPSKPLWSKAIEYGERAVAEDPNFAEAYYLLSQIYERTKWTYLEITNLEKFIDIAQGNTNIKISYERLSDALYRLAYSKYAQNEIDSTIKNLEDSILYQPNNIKARIFLMRIYYDTGQITKALEQAEAIKKYDAGDSEIDWFFKQYQQAEIYGKDAYELYVAGYNAYSNKKWSDAIRLLTQSTSINKKFKEAHYFLGLSYYQSGDFDNAIKHLEEAVQLDPFDNNARIYLNKAIEEREFGREAVWTFNQGYKLYIGGEYDDALIKFKDSARINPNYEKTRIYLMRTYFHLNQMDEYLEEREKIGGDRVLDIDWEKEYYQLSYNFYSLGNYRAALEKLNEILEVNPDFLEARFLIAETQYQLENYEEANNHYKYIIKNNIESEYYENALLGSGWCSYLLGNFSDAEIYLELLVRNYPKSLLYQEGVYKLGRTFFMEKKYNNAISLYENLLTDDSLSYDKAEIKYILGQSYFWEEIYDKAKEYFIDIINNSPDFELFDDTIYYYSFVLYREGKFEEARMHLEKILKKESSIAEEIAYLLARVLLELKEYDRVIEINKSLIDEVKDQSMAERVLFDLGLAYSRKGDQKSSVTYFEMLKQRFPESELSGIMAIELAHNYYDLGEYQNVISSLENLDSEEALELKIEAAAKLGNDETLFSLYQELSDKTSDDSIVREGYFLQAKSKYENEEYSEAIKIFQKIENMEITDKMREEVYYWQGLSFYRMADYMEAENYFSRISLSINDEVAIRALYMLGEINYKQEKYLEAIQYYQQFLKTHSTHSLAANVQYNVSWSYLSLGNYSEAIDSLSKLINNYPDNQFVEEGQFLIGKIYFLSKSNSESKENLDIFLKTFPESKLREEAFYILAQINLEEEKWIDSIVYFERLVNDFPNSQYLSGSLYGLCLSYFKKEEYEKALQVGDRYITKYSSGTFICDILYISAICEEELGDQNQAKEKYEMILERCPETTYAQNIRKQLENKY